MRIHLFRSIEMPAERYAKLLHYMQSFRGPMQFLGSDNSLDMDTEDLEFEPWSNDPDSLREVTSSMSLFCEDIDFSASFEELGPYRKPEQVKLVPWSAYFEEMNRYRRNHDLGDDEFVILLTDQGNEHNWFSAPDMNGKRNVFVQTSGWGYFLESESMFPIAYQVLTNVLRFFMVNGWHEFNEIIHERPRGCMNDFNANKHEIVIKLRTADLCKDCTKRIIDRKVDGAIMTQAFEMMESIRANVLFRDRLTITQRPSRLRISGPRRTIDFPDMPNCELRLTPLEKTIYLFYLNHPEGVAFTHLWDHRDELHQLYATLNPNTENEEINKRVLSLVNPLSNSVSEKVAKIKSKLNTLLGAQLAEYYIISGSSGQPRKIGLDRVLVEWG
jgi:hypothetical protein